MMNHQEQRWTEVQFYYIIYDVWKFHHNFKDILAFVKCVKIFGDEFNESRICSLAQAALLNQYLKINRDEFIVLCWMHRIPLKAVRKYDKKIYSQTYNRLVKQYKTNPADFYFYPRNKEEDIIEIQKFINTIDNMKGVGITWTLEPSKRFGRGFKLSESKHYRSVTMTW
jgi:hypothetical protein